MHWSDIVVTILCLVPSSLAYSNKKNDAIIIRRPNGILDVRSVKDNKTMPATKYLHRISKYKDEYLKEYKKMISSLLPEASMYERFSSSEFLPLKNEISTVKSRYSSEKARLPICSSEDEKNWRSLKVLQLEERNIVTLKENKLTGFKVVEKLMYKQKNYDTELEFFGHAHSGAKSYYPALICSAKTNNSKGRFSILIEYIKGQNSHLIAAKATSEQLRFMVAQLFNSIVELHKVGFIHCDLTPSNVIVSRDFEVKLIDFGMALPVGKGLGFRGSYYTRAPELHAKVPGKIDVAIDWWAFGCTVAIWYYYHFNPDAVNDTDSIYAFTPMKLSNSLYFRSGIFPSRFPVDLRKFLSLFLTLDPELRTFSTVRLQEMARNHEFFNGFNWSTAEKN